MASSLSHLLLLSAVLALCSAVCTGNFLTKKTNTNLVNMNKMAMASNDFALRIHRRLAGDSPGNVFFSPFSLSTAFGMLFYGTNGKTAKELRKVLGYDAARLSDELVHQTFHEYLNDYLKSGDSSSYALKSANAILLDRHIKVIPAYKKEVQYLYQASVKELDFASESSRALEEINDWVSEKTNGKIDKLVDRLDSSVVLVLLNAVYFKGIWKSQFQLNLTEPGIFCNNGLQSRSKKISMMKTSEYLPYNDAFGVQAVELPYKENISMVVLLPKGRDGLESLEKILTLGKFSSITGGMEITKVNLTFPKFNLEYSREMSRDFRSLGATDIFNPGADFSGMTPDNIAVNDVIHRAVLEVNEEGSEAAGASGIFTGRRRPAEGKEVEVVVDHPFMLAIVDSRNGLILFMGHVTNL